MKSRLAALLVMLSTSVFCLGAAANNPGKTYPHDGSIKDVQITQSSGNQSMDYSGLRAIQSSNPMPALPNDYSGTYVNVIFDFDLAMTQ